MHIVKPLMEARLTLCWKAYSSSYAIFSSQPYEMHIRKSLGLWQYCIVCCCLCVNKSVVCKTLIIRKVQWTFLVQLWTEVLCASQVRPDQGLNSWPPDHDSTAHVTKTLAPSTRPSVTSIIPPRSGKEKVYYFLVDSHCSSLFRCLSFN